MPKRDIRTIKDDLSEFAEATMLPTQHVAKALPEEAPQERAPANPKNARSPKKTKEVLVKQTFQIRASLRKALKRKALEEDTTVQSLLHLGLKQLGLPVTDDDLRGDRRREH